LKGMGERGREGGRETEERREDRAIPGIDTRRGETKRERTKATEPGSARLSLDHIERGGRLALDWAWGSWELPISLSPIPSIRPLTVGCHQQTVRMSRAWQRFSFSLSSKTSLPLTSYRFKTASTLISGPRRGWRLAGPHPRRRRLIGRAAP
jgi:hypothetical protein